LENSGLATDFRATTFHGCDQNAAGWDWFVDRTPGNQGLGTIVPTTNRASAT